MSLWDEVTACANILKSVFVLKDVHRYTWRDKPDVYWLARLQEEVLELGLALRDEHEHTPDVELEQIAAICLNWLEKRNE